MLLYTAKYAENFHITITIEVICSRVILIFKNFKTYRGYDV